MNLIRVCVVLDRIPCGGAGQFVSFGVSVSSRQVLFVNQYRQVRHLVVANDGLSVKKTVSTRKQE